MPENATNFAVYVVIFLFSITDVNTQCSIYINTIFVQAYCYELARLFTLVSWLSMH